eukprot:TRINITY_DN77209_c0_g1_i1.p1 TRINITY_DN77209_c0_g1~~TRINITY_DN77209_c0_g1_i1.p1  ORF type:complete len:276 (-),score=55.20 TRINITY_DN77209_c0_g1_i1:176-931(-)
MDFENVSFSVAANTNSSCCAGGGASADVAIAEGMSDVDEFSDEEDTKVRVRRPPSRLTAENHIYVSRRQNLTVLQKIARRLLEKRGHTEIFVHGMGATIPKALHLVQDLLVRYADGQEAIRLSEPTVDIGTVDVVDELCGGGFEAEVEERRVSSLTLRLQRCDIASQGGAKAVVGPSISATAHARVDQPAACVFAGLAATVAAAESAAAEAAANAPPISSAATLGDSRHRGAGGRQGRQKGGRGRGGYRGK